MSADFIRMISEIHSQRYVMQINNLIASKTPCGLFYGFNVPQNAAEMFISLKNQGLNMTCICVIDNPSQVGGGYGYTGRNAGRFS